MWMRFSFTKHSPERPKSPTSNENSGLTQELGNLTILDKKANTPSSSNVRVQSPYRDRNSWNPTTGSDITKNPIKQKAPQPADDSVPEHMKAMTKMQLIGTKGECNTPRHLIAKNT